MVFGAVGQINRISTVGNDAVTDASEQRRGEGKEYQNHDRLFHDRSSFAVYYAILHE
jgi:hypothetical protein